jgi:hypothetical protein
MQTIRRTTGNEKVGLSRLGLVAGAALALGACGGGSEVLAVVGFLGTGGGTWYATTAETGPPGARTSFRAFSCNDGRPCLITFTVIDPPSTTGGSAPYRQRYTVRVEGNLPGCSSVTGTIERTAVDLGTCGRGEYLGVNELRLTTQLGSLSLLHDFRPDLVTGVWVDVRDSTRRFKFTSNGAGTGVPGVQRAAGCEIGPAGRSATRIDFTVSNYQSFTGSQPFETARTPQLIPRTAVAALATSGGTFAGDFTGGDAMTLANAQGGLLLLQRRDETATCS